MVINISNCYFNFRLLHFLTTLAPPSLRGSSRFITNYFHYNDDHDKIENNWSEVRAKF